MSLHIEWATTGEGQPEIHGPGARFSGYEEPVAEFGVLIGGDGGGALMLEGSAESLHEWAATLTARLQKLLDAPPATTTSAAEYVWCYHTNKAGGWCEHSGKPIGDDVDPDDVDARCPDGCPGSEVASATEEDPDPLGI